MSCTITLPPPPPVPAAVRAYYDAWQAIRVANAEGHGLPAVVALVDRLTALTPACRAALEATPGRAVRLYDKGWSVCWAETGVYVRESRIVVEPIDAMRMGRSA